jgi:acyl carrier protein
VGLETVEIVMEVEKTFGISLPDSRAAAIRTVGELHECIVKILGRENDNGQLADTVRADLQRALASVRKTTASPVDANAQLSTLFPYFGRKRAWRQLEKAVDLPLPPLVRPHLLSTIVTVAAIPVGWIFALLAIGPFIPPRPADRSGWLLPILMLILGYLSIFVFWLVGRCLTAPFSAFFPRKLRTIGELSQAILQRHYGRVVKREQGFNRDEVWCILQAIVARVLGIDCTKVTPEARFVEDLGAG